MSTATLGQQFAEVADPKQEREEKVPCDFERCNNTASHYAVCPLCMSIENACSPCKDVTTRAASHPITFSKSCKHTVGNLLVKFIPRW